MKRNLFINKLLIGCALYTLQIACAQSANKHYIVDVYGTTEITSAQIENKFKKELTILATSTQGARILPEKQKEFIIALNKLFQSLKTKNYTLYNVAPINYSDKETRYITFDYVKTADLKKVEQNWLPKQTKNIPDTYHLISNWAEYFKTGNDLLFIDKEKIDAKECPAHHCMFGFQHSKLQKYKAIFDAAEEHKSNLVKIMRQDKDGEKRAAAIFVLAHIKNQDELVKLILPSIDDSYGPVRNNVLRVLIYVAQKNKNVSLPVEKLFFLAGYPNTAERNKALYVISVIANKPGNAELIKRSIGKQLIANLKLQQPINHQPAYEILKTISGKNYGERDYRAWESWLRGG